MSPSEESGTTGLAFTPRAFYLFVVAGALLVVAFLARTPVPLIAALAFLLAPIAAGIVTPRPPILASLTWTSLDGASDITIRGRVEFDRRLDTRGLRLRFLRRPPLVERKSAVIHPGPHGVSFELAWTTPIPCIVEVPLPIALWRDPLELVEIPVQLSGSPLVVERFPPEITQVARVRLERTTPIPGEVRSRAVGAAGEFFAVRPAVSQDSSRRINWRATARLGRRMANDFLQDRTGDLLILIDARPTSLGSEADSTLVALSGVAALGIATGFLREKARVGLAVFDEFLRVVPLGSGRLQRRRIAVLLDTTTVGKVAGPAERCAVSLRRYFPPGLTTLVLSSMVDESMTELLLHIRRRGFGPVVLSPSPIPLAAGALNPADAIDPLALALLRHVRRLRLAEVWREAPVVDWDEYWTLAPLVHYLRTPVRNRVVT